MSTVIKEILINIVQLQLVPGGWSLIRPKKYLFFVK